MYTGSLQFPQPHLTTQCWALPIYSAQQLHPSQCYAQLTTTLTNAISQKIKKSLVQAPKHLVRFTHRTYSQGVFNSIYGHLMLWQSKNKSIFSIPEKHTHDIGHFTFTQGSENKTKQEAQNTCCKEKVIFFVIFRFFPNNLCQPTGTIKRP